MIAAAGHSETVAFSVMDQRRPAARFVGASGLENQAADAQRMSRPAKPFDAMLRAATAAAPLPEKEDVLRTAATQLVASSLVLPVLASLREDSLHADGPFSPGAAERRFGPLLDEKFADQITQAANFSLIDRIVEQFAASLSDAAASAGAKEFVNVRV